MDKQKDNVSSKKDQLDSTNKELNPNDHNYSTNNEISSTNNKTNSSANSNKDNESRPKKRLKNLKDSSSKSTDSSTIKSNNSNESTKKSTTQRKSDQNKQKDISSSQINQSSKDDADNQDNDQNMNDNTNDNETTVTSTTSNKKSSKDIFKESIKDEQNLPRVPPLRIVINSNLSSNKKDNNDKSNSSTNLLNSSQHNTTTEKSFSIDNQTINSTNLTITTTTSSNSTNLNLDDIDNDDQSNYSKDLNNTSTTGRVTRSQRAAAQTTNNDDKDETNDQTNQTTNKDTINKDLGRKRKKNLELNKNRFKVNSTGNSTDNKTKHHLNHLNEDNDDNDSTSSSNSSVNNKELNQLNNQLQCLEKKQFQMPSYNCYHLYLNIRRQVDHRRTQQIHIVQPKIPDNFNQFLFNTGSYLLDKEEGNKFQSNQLEKNKEFILSLNNDDNNEVPKNLIGTNMNSLFNEQELERRKLKLQHRIEKDKLRLSVEQEILRVYARAELAMANLNLPLLSACTVLKDEEIYNSIDEENDGSLDNNEIIFNYQPNQFANPCLNNNNTQVSTDNQSDDNKTTQSIKSCYDSKLLNELLQDVYNKWLKIKHDILLRHKREAESLQAVQKLQWDWSSKDFYTSTTTATNNTDTKINSTNNINVDDCYVPLVKVEDDFDLPIKNVN